MFYRVKVRTVFKFLSVPVLLAQSALALGIEPPTNVRAVSPSPTQIVWSWDRADAAQQYELTIDGIYAGLTADAQHTSDGVYPGEHSISVKAVDQNGAYSSPTLAVRINTTDRSGDLHSEQAVDPASLNYPEVFEKPGYELSFSDEFNGTSLNPNKWNTQLRWDGDFNGERFEYRVINGEDQFYVNIYSDDQEHLNSVVPSYNPFEFDGSRLAIRAQRNPLKTNNNDKSYGPLSEIVAQQEFMSGAISTYDKFTQKYGYFEARIKIPSHVGTFPAFWLHHQRRENEDTRKTEIDIMENLGHAPWYIYNSFHYFENVSETYNGDAVSIKPYPEGQIFSGTDYSLDYHTYAVEWEPGYIAWLLDGEIVSEVRNENVDHEELYVILNLAMGGVWTNFPANSGGLGREPEFFFPNFDDLNAFANPALEIDYVRVYKRR